MCILRDHSTDMCILRDHSADMCILRDHSTDMCILRDHSTDMFILRDQSTDTCIRDLTLKFLGSTASSFGDSSLYSVDPLSVDSIEGHNQVSGKGFPTTGPWIEAGNVVIHRGLHVSNVTASCSLCAIGYKELFTDRHRCPDVLYIVVMLMGYVVDWNCMSMDFKVLRLGVSFGITRLIRASFGITRLICASFGITRLICASLGITRLIGVSFGITRLIRASFWITGLMCKGTARGRPTRGKKDA
ncbi:hypothetical protein E5676_scaffold1085G00130 [Cucumis melo var. makuwa]|uniref:Uncharacterized protein n=1 Tax=Cucumis melo var. makuwa TaxID=1194695 RepID=A0A5D3C1T2_CUCMM|nr:hypothetical protein E5676_scaffold1085G00130 [Cucumis melo var. makuwa]